jgi:hypothetical protein
MNRELAQTGIEARSSSAVPPRSSPTACRPLVGIRMGTRRSITFTAPPIAPPP